MHYCASRNEVSEMLGLTAKWPFTLSTSGSFYRSHSDQRCMLVLRYLDSRETSAIKVEKIDFPKIKLASLAWKLFLHRINSVKALRHQKATNGSGCRISRFKRNIRARITRLSLFQSATLFRHFRNEKSLTTPRMLLRPQSSIFQRKEWNRLLRGRPDPV